MIISSFSPKQGRIFKFINSSHSALICDGAVRSGKSICMSIAFVIWIMQSFNNTSFAICSKTLANAERNILIPLLSVQGLPYSFNFKSSKHILEISHGDVKNQIYLFGGKDQQSFALIQGLTLGGVFFDEVALMPRSFVEQAIARTLTFVNSKLWFNCNPDTPNHWFYKEWISNYSKRNALYLHFLMSDNPILSPEAIKKASDIFTGVFHDRYIKGIWVAAEGSIYRHFIDDKASFFTDTPEFDVIFIGVDFGGNKSAHCFVASGITKDFSKITVLASERHLATGLSPSDLYLLLDQFIHFVTEKYGVVDTIYCDSAEQTLINGIKSRTRIPVRNSFKFPIVDRIRITLSLMSEHRFFITKDAISLSDAFLSAVYSEKSLQDKRLDDGSSDIDSLDAFEYSIERYLYKF